MIFYIELREKENIQPEPRKLVAMELQAEDIKSAGQSLLGKDSNEPDKLVEKFENLKNEGFTYDFDSTSHANAFSNKTVSKLDTNESVTSFHQEEKN